MTDAQQALAQVRDALAAMRGDWLGDGFTKLRRSQIVAVLDEQAAENERLRGLLCKCDMRTRLVGDGCEFCNPQLADELAKEQR